MSVAPKDGGSRTRSSVKGDDAVYELADMLSFKLSLLAKSLERRLARLVSQQFGLSVAEYRVLAQVMMRPGSTVRAIAARTLVDKAQVSRAVASLEEQQLVLRSMSSRDRRSPVLTATRPGRALIRRIAPLRLAQEDELLALLDDSSIEAFRTSLTVLFNAFIEPSEEPATSAAADRRDTVRAKRAAHRPSGPHAVG